MWMVAAKLGLLALVIVPIWLGWLTFWRRYWRGAGAGELLLGAGLGVPLVLILEVALFGSVPKAIVDRPLDWLGWAHGAVCLLVLLWVRWRRTDLRGSLRRVTTSWRDATREPGVGLLLISVMTWHLAVMVYGAWNWSVLVDDIQYHLPQALQVYQDGRLGRVVTAQEPWADGYPRGSALVWAWSMIMTRTDAGIHPINGCFAIQLMLAAAVGARRVGCSRRWALLAAALVPTAPIVSFITAITYTDVAQAALLGTSAVMAMPVRRGRWGAPSAILCGLSAAMALWVKFQMAPAIAMIVVYRLGHLFLQWRRGGLAPRGTLSVRAQLLLGAAAMLAAAPPYIKPLNLRIGSLVLFVGPMDQDDLAAGVQMPWLLRFARYWTDWLADPSGESPGGFGPLLTMLMAAPTLAVCLSQLARPWRRAVGRPGMVMLALLLLAVAVVPLYHWPRYSMWLLVPMSVCTAWVVQVIADRPLQQWICLVAAALCAGNAALYGRYLIAKVSMDVGLAADRGVDLWTEHRNRLLVDALPYGDRLRPTPQTRAALRAAMKPGETVVTSVHIDPVLLTDPDYTYRVDFRPIKPWPIFAERFDPLADLERGEVEAPAWLEGLNRDKVSAAVVYDGTAEDRTLHAAESGFERVWVQPDRGRPVIVIYRRTR
jgi:hypothetical protein